MKKNLTFRLFAAIAIIALTGCGDSTEDKLYGTWQAVEEDATTTLALADDYSACLIMAFPKPEGFIEGVGSWQLAESASGKEVIECKFSSYKAGGAWNKVDALKFFELSWNKKYELAKRNHEVYGFFIVSLGTDSLTTRDADGSLTRWHRVD